MQVNKFKAFFKNLFEKFSVREITIFVATLVVSITLIVVGANKGTSTKPKDNTNEVIKKPLFPSVKVYDVDGNRREVFETSFYVQYEGTACKSELDRVIEVLNEYLVPYHCMFDRHAYYYKEEPVNPTHPTSEEKENLIRYNNLRTINKSIGEEVEIDEPLFDILQKSLDLSIKTNGNFNPFVGKLYDFWKVLIDPLSFNESQDPLNNAEQKATLENYVSFVPKTKEEILSALTLRSEDNKYYATLNKFNGAEVGDLELTLGGVGKGYMEDILKEEFINRGLTRGLINGGTSSFITLQDKFCNEPYKFNMATIIPYDLEDKDWNPTSYHMEITGKFAMSTSGTYTGKRFSKDGKDYLRSHIIDPKTGYPANNSHELANAISSTLSGMELDALTTALLVSPLDEAISFLNETYSDTDLSYLFLLNESETYSLVKSSNYPRSKDSSLIIFDPYVEKEEA